MSGVPISQPYRRVSSDRCLLSEISPSEFCSGFEALRIRGKVMISFLHGPERIGTYISMHAYGTNATTRPNTTRVKTLVHPTTDTT